jgi:uncharacterized protein YyaL (SSP411 family)
MEKGDTYDRFLRPAINWLMLSGIRNKSSETTYGGFNSGYDLREKSYSLAYCEITGYAINLLSNLYRLKKNHLFLEFAKNAGNFLVDMQYKGSSQKIFGAFPKGYSFLQKAVVYDFYSFDVAICISALIDLFRETNEQRFLASAKIAGDWLVNQMQFDDGAFRSMFDCSIQDFAQIKKWFGNRGCLHAKNAIGLLKLSDVTGDAKFKESATRVCDWVLNLQKRNGAFVATESESYVFAHAQCYATEGLLHVHLNLNNPKYLEAALESGKWLIQAQNADGSLNRFYYKNSFIPTKMTDATSQALRIWAILYRLTREKDYLDAAQKSAKFLVSMQCQNKSDPNAFGGLFYQSRAVWKLRYVYPFVSAWSTMFAIHAFYALKNLSESSYEKASVF